MLSVGLIKNRFKEYYSTYYYCSENFTLLKQRLMHDSLIDELRPTSFYRAYRGVAI